MTHVRNMSIDEAVEYATEAIGQGDLLTGKSALDYVLKQAPQHPIALLWMACCVQDEDMRRECYRRIAA